MAPVFALPGLFGGQVSTAVNGSLWSIPIEFFMYLIVPIFGMRRIWFCRAIVFPAILSFAVLGGLYFTVIQPKQLEPVIYWSSVPDMFRSAPYFFMGAAFSVWDLDRLLSLPIAVVLCLLLAIPVGGGPVFEVALFLTTSYIVLSFAMTPHPWLSRVGRRFDVSYGIYLYAFPIQQTLISRLDHLGPKTLILLTIPLAYLCGLASWVLVERPALRLKPRHRPVHRVETATGRRVAILPEESSPTPGA